MQSTTVISGTQYRCKGESLEFRPTNAPDGTYLSAPFDQGVYVASPPSPDAPAWMTEQGERHVLLTLEDLRWLTDIMQLDGKRPNVEGLCLGEEAVVTAQSSVIRAVRHATLRPGGYATLQSGHVRAFLALPDLQGPVIVAYNTASGWGLLRDVTTGRGLYAPLRQSALGFPKYGHLLGVEQHLYNVPWGPYERMMYSSPKRETYIHVPLPRYRLRLDAGLLHGVPDGTLCYSDPRDAFRINVISNDGRKETVIALCTEET